MFPWTVKLYINSNNVKMLHMCFIFSQDFTSGISLPLFELLNATCSVTDRWGSAIVWFQSWYLTQGLPHPVRWDLMWRIYIQVLSFCVSPILSWWTEELTHFLFALGVSIDVIPAVSFFSAGLKLPVFGLGSLNRTWICMSFGAAGSMLSGWFLKNRLGFPLGTDLSCQALPL